MLALLAGYHSARAADSATLCTKPFAIEEQCSADAPNTLAVLIAGARDPEKALQDTVKFWHSHGKWGSLLADEIARLVGTRPSPGDKTSEITPTERFDRDTFIKLCILHAASLCPNQVSKPSTAPSRAEACPSGRCASVTKKSDVPSSSMSQHANPKAANNQHSVVTDVQVKDVSDQKPPSLPYCSAPIISGERAEFTLMEQLTTREPPGDETTTCNLEQCTREWADIVASTRGRAGGSAAMRRTVRRDAAMAECLRLTSQYPWQDEGSPESGGPDRAYNCRDASMGFIACMSQYGFGAGDVFRVHIKCTNCELNTTNGHSINMYRREDGKICPVEPSKPEHGTPNSDVFPGCCLPTAQEAAACAELRYCSRRRFNFMSCKPAGSPKIFNPDECPKESSYCQDEDGSYNCPADPSKCIPKPKPELDECTENMKSCYETASPSIPTENLCKLCDRCTICPSWWNCLGRRFRIPLTATDVDL
jgi:hypothetical protein